MAASDYEGLSSESTHQALKEELADLAEQMVQNARQFGEVLQKDNEALERATEAQQRHIDDTRTKTVKAQEMARSSQMSFVMEMVLAVIGIVLFLFMLVFIHVTKGLV
eukprot:GHVQ01004802.1.p1 GENE.GHVQ01004802.1~~GHVQ01004802.1.p1  ORF type:complete len:108 (+),score=16.61 GHVQ01004802.1:390-713(+)